MKTYRELLSEISHKPTARYAYHGTSHHNLESILNNGLVAGNRKDSATRSRKRVYLTTDPRTAADEAYRTTDRDEDTGKLGIGGDPIILRVDMHHPSMQKNKYHVDLNWHNKTDAEIHSFHTGGSVHPDAIVSVHDAGEDDDHPIGHPMTTDQARGAFGIPQKRVSR